MGEIKKQNTIVLRNLPSNLIEEATIVFKNKKTVKEIEKAEKERKKQESTIIPVKNKEGKRQSYAIKEAEMVIIDYVSGIEEKRKNINLRNNRVNKKYKRLKIYSIATTALFLLETITFVIVK
ncbi:MAG: hypothetical protein EGQ16_02505 [Clostridiales bacterium]|nr:hypothetical protein [Clostridiales bacterium]